MKFISQSVGSMSGENSGDKCKTGNGAIGPDVRSSELYLDLSPKALNLGPKIKVLVSLVFPTDKAVGATIEARDDIIRLWDDVARFYDQASFGMKKIEATVSNWHSLKDDAKAYVTNKVEECGPNIRNDGEVLAQFAAEAAQAAFQDVPSLDEFQILACIINLDGNEENGVAMGPLRGYSDRSAFRFKSERAGIDISLKAGPLGIIALDEQADWGRCAHELGHFLLTVPTKTDNPLVPAAFNAEDLYDDPDECADSSATGFDLMGHHDDTPLFSGYNMEQLGFYPQDRIAEIGRNKGDGTWDYYVTAHGMSPDEIPNEIKEWYYLLKIPVSDSLIYYVETRQRSKSPYPQVFDPSINVGDVYDKNLTDDENWGGVLVTRVLKGTVTTSQQMRFITVKHDPCPNPRTGHIEPHTLSASHGSHGSRDKASGLTIEVLDRPLNARPMVYHVKVTMDRKSATGFLPAAPGDKVKVAINPRSTYDLYIRRQSGGDESWECPDIWIERELIGDKAGEHKWDFGWDDVENKPRYNGDRPVQDKKHRVWARIRCDGAPVNADGVPEPEARDVTVVLYDLKPLYDEQPIEIGRATCNVKSDGYTDVCLHPGKSRWIPAAQNSLWLVVDISPDKTGSELDSCDNIGRLVIFDKDFCYTIPGSLPEGDESENLIKFDVPVYNPSTVKENNKIWLAYGVDYGTSSLAGDKVPEVPATEAFNVKMPEYVLLGPGEKTSLTLEVRPSADYLKNTGINSPPVRIRVLQYLLDPGGLASQYGGDPQAADSSVPRVPIRGLTYWVSIKQKVGLSLAADPAGSGPHRILLKGCTIPATGTAERCFIDLTGEDADQAFTHLETTAADGSFQTVFENLVPGTYMAKASIIRSKTAGQTWSKPVQLKINDNGEIVP